MIFYMVMHDRSTSAPDSPTSPRTRPAVPDPRSSLRSRWDAAVPTLVAVGMGLLAFLGAAFSGARPS